MPDILTPHEPTDECWGHHCSFHHVDEPAEGAYLICFECGHAYLTAEDLRAAFMAEVAPDLSSPLPEPPPAEGVWFCPLCAHDF